MLIHKLNITLKKLTKMAREGLTEVNLPIERPDGGTKKISGIPKNKTGKTKKKKQKKVLFSLFSILSFCALAAVRLPIAPQLIISSVAVSAGMLALPIGLYTLNFGVSALVTSAFCVFAVFIVAHAHQPSVFTQSHPRWVSTPSRPSDDNGLKRGLVFGK